MTEIEEYVEQARNYLRMSRKYRNPLYRRLAWEAIYAGRWMRTLERGEQNGKREMAQRF
jgi:hypothetical protein